jgi:DNA invertase Pin-like site-specific DNA recombinase
MIIGYGRTSTIEQVAGLEAQIRDLKAAGAEKLFSENVSSVAPRKQLEAAIEFAQAEGRYRGGIPTARAKAKQVIALVDAGKTRQEAAEELGISIRSVFRILRSRKDAEKAPVAPPVARIRARPQVSV